jgi:hypothetical protein
MIYYYMNLEYPCNLIPLKLLLTLQNKIKDENATIKQAHDLYMSFKTHLVILVPNANMT